VLCFYNYNFQKKKGEIITEILNIIETTDPEEAQMRILLREFPSFADLYLQIYDVDVILLYIYHIYIINFIVLYIYCYLRCHLI
jgi:hypothetical protein